MHDIARMFLIFGCSWVFDDATYGAVPGLEYKVIEIGGRSYKFCQHERTILPKLQNLLFAKRKAVKELLKKETDPFQKRVLDARQLGLKISMNGKSIWFTLNQV